MTTMSKTHLRLLLSALLLTICFSGCGEKKIGVEGTVTRKGVPLASGTITFIPDAVKGTTHGANAIANIDNGKFVLPDKFGVSGGWYKVIISGASTVTGEGDQAVEKLQFADYTTSFEFKADSSTPITIDIPK